MAQSKIKLAKATYNFSVDGGAIGTITPKAGAVIPNGAQVLRAWTDVTSNMTSGGSATVAIQVACTTPVVIKTATAFNSADYTGQDFQRAATVLGKTDSAGPITLTVATAALTAGVVNVYVEYVN